MKPRKQVGISFFMHAALILKNKALQNIEFIMQICYGINLIPNHANDIINII